MARALAAILDHKDENLMGLKSSSWKEPGLLRTATRKSSHTNLSPAIPDFYITEE